MLPIVSGEVSVLLWLAVSCALDIIGGNHNRVIMRMFWMCCVGGLPVKLPNALLVMLCHQWEVKFLQRLALLIVGLSAFQDWDDSP